MDLYLWPGTEMVAGFHDNRHRSFRPATVEGVEYQVSSQENLLVSPTLHHLVEGDSTQGQDIIWLMGDRVEQGDSLDITLSCVVNKQVTFFTMTPSWKGWTVFVLKKGENLVPFYIFSFGLRCCWFVHNLQTHLLHLLCLRAVLCRAKVQQKTTLGFC